MAAPVLRTTDISLPVLQTSTSSRVMADPAPLNRQQNNMDMSDDDMLPLPPPPEMFELDYQHDQNITGYGNNNNQQQYHQYQPEQSIQHQNEQGEKYDILRQQQREDEAANRLQAKYASPDNILHHQNTLNVNDNLDDVDNITNSINTHISISENKDLPVIDSIKKSGGTGSVSAFSDASSDISDATTSAPSSSGSAPPVARIVPPTTEQGATETDIQQVDMFYRSQKTDVRVCRSLANMYLSASKTLERMPAGNSPNNKNSPTFPSPDPAAMSMDDWDFIKTGIPVLVLNTGEHLRTRKLSIILAEKGTGFSLWEDLLSLNTRYETPHTNFHTLSLSTDQSRLVGFSFDEANAATEFAEALNSLLPTPDEDDSNDKKKKKKKEKKPPKQKYKPPRKIDISQPCCFVHVTKLERSNLLGLPSSMFPPPPSGAELSPADMMRSRSQSSVLSEASTTPSEH